MKSRLLFITFILVSAMALGSLLVGGISYAMQATQPEQPANTLLAPPTDNIAPAAQPANQLEPQNAPADNLFQAESGSGAGIGTIANPVEVQTSSRWGFGEHEEHEDHERFEHEHEREHEGFFGREGHEFDDD
ncbi:MAG: hypothetical protein D6768_02070 [Chloroflexi bacterium]|nr:MAG: hypothetical protein D6768_02070 [Chloroflexota bacterium]